ncbi:MAG: O-antigen ligase family protein [Deltaproteobacteria bacterium]|nr:O-antigen ligase family protein [Deltaproteobacteria bacterium]
MFESIYNLNKQRFLRLRENIISFAFLNNVVSVLMGIYIFINPFPHMTAIKEICFYLSFFIVFLLIILKKTDFSFQTPLLIPFCLFVCWVFAGLFFALDKENSMHDFYAHLLRYAAIYFILINFFNSRKRFMSLSRIIIASSISYSVLGLFYFYHIMEYSWTTRFSYGGAKGLLGYEVAGNSICALVIFSILLSLIFFMNGSLRRKTAIVLCLIPQIALVFLVQSKGAYIALFLSLIVLLWKNKKILLSILIILVVITVISPIKGRLSGLTTSDGLFKNYRIKMMFTTLEIVKDYPVTGVGFGNETYGKKIDLKMYDNRAPEKYRQNRNKIIAAPHNMLLNILVRTGFLGLALFLSILFIFARMCWRCARYGEDNFVKKWGLCIGSVFLAFLVIGMFEQMFHHIIELILFTILSMGTILWKINNNIAG